MKETMFSDTLGLLSLTGALAASGCVLAGRAGRWRCLHALVMASAMLAAWAPVRSAILVLATCVVLLVSAPLSMLAARRVHATTMDAHRAVSAVVMSALILLAAASGSPSMGMPMPMHQGVAPIALRTGAATLYLAFTAVLVHHGVRRPRARGSGRGALLALLEPAAMGAAVAAMAAM